MSQYVGQADGAAEGSENFYKMGKDSSPTAWPWSSPEQLEGISTKSSDVWALGKQKKKTEKKPGRKAKTCPWSPPAPLPCSQCLCKESTH